MKYIENPSAEPYFNQAFEEYVFTHYTDEDILLLWQNSPAVVCGRYQNLFAEADIPAAEEKNIALVRRETGGGTVYHDLGNLNYTFMANQIGSGADYLRFLKPVVEALRHLGIPAEAGRLCDIAVKGKKISGSAQKISGGRVLHHGTLLVCADLTSLRQVANGGRENYKSRGVQSSPWPVANLTELIPGLTCEGLKAHLLREFGGIPCALTERELQEVEALAAEKYRTWQWNFGNTPAYTLTRELAHGTLCLEANHGVIQSLRITGTDRYQSVLPMLTGQKLEKNTVAAICAAAGVPELTNSLF